MKKDPRPVTKTAVPIGHIAQLAHLNLTPEQLAKYQAGLSSVLGHMQEITQLDLSSVPLTSRVIEEENIWREDDILPSLTQDQALQNAPRSHDGYFMVNAIFEGRDG